MKDYKVRWLIDDTYQVIDSYGDSVYQGSLADCEAYIRLKEGGYLE